MSSQVLSEQALGAWVGLLRGHATLTRELNAELVAEHDLTLNDYEVLLHLARSPERRMRRIDLAESVLLTASGITRLLDGLERAGLVERGECPEDRRVAYAVLTEAGLEKLRGASQTHCDGVQARFVERYSDEELELLGKLLARVTGDTDPAPNCCSPG